MVDRGEEIARRRIVLARLDGDDALPDRRNEFVGVERLGRGVGEAEPLEAGEREQRRIDLAGIELAQPRLHIAAERYDAEVGPQPLHQRLPPQRGGADHRARGQFPKRLRLAADEDVAGIFARQHRRDDETIRQYRRHVLGGMHGDVDLAGRQRLLDLLGEEPFAAEFRQRTVADGVAGGRYGADLDPFRRPAMRGRQAGPHHGGLGQRERTAARPDPQGDRTGLHLRTSQCYAEQAGWERDLIRDRTPAGKW